MFHSTQKGSAGRLYNGFRYLRKLDRDQKAKLQLNDVSDVSQTNDANGLEQLPENYTDDLLYLKTVVVSNENLDDIRRVMAKTRNVRDEMMKDGAIDYLENFPFFFVRPELVSIPIEISFVFFIKLIRLFDFISLFFYLVLYAFLPSLLSIFSHDF